MRRAMRVLTVCALSLGVAAVAAKADRPNIRDAKGSAVTFRVASNQPAAGLRKETLANGQVVYVSPAPVANAMEILDAQSGDNGTTLRLSGQATSRLGSQVAVYIGDKIASVGPIGADGQVTFGNLSVDQADRINRAVQAQPAVPVGGPVLTVVPAGQRDGLYLVDVFVQGVPDLRVYQISLVSGGGNTGSLQLETVKSDQARQDYVFGTAQVVDASSPTTGLLAGVLYDGAVNVTAPRYVGTYGFRPSAEANGTFRVNVNLSDETILADHDNEQMGYSSGADARIVIGSRMPVQNK